ncbi:putative membrane protein [Bradyrhizobium sp. USDA 4341]
MAVFTDAADGGRAMANVHRQPIHPALVPFPVAYFAAAFLTDFAYWRTAEVMWERFSVWLIAGGLVMAALLAIAAVIDLLFRKQRPAWNRALPYACAVAVSILNVLVHSRDGYTAVVPTGLTLSGLALVLLLFAVSTGWTLTNNRRSGASA